MPSLKLFHILTRKHLLFVKFLEWVPVFCVQTNQVGVFACVGRLTGDKSSLMERFGP